MNSYTDSAIRIVLLARDTNSQGTDLRFTIYGSTN